MGYIGNNGTRETDYATSIANRTIDPSTDNGAFWNNSGTSVSHADFDQSLTAISSYNRGSAAGGYTVRAVDTLHSIAANVWGDASLWYKVAEAKSPGR